MNKLSASTVRQISSGQVISEIHCVVKELVENAIDAKASRIEVALQNFGLDKIEVVDNGSGVAETDAPFLAKRHFTSKLSSFEDLASVASYGFRGEGVASICAVADLHVVTKTAGEAVARAYVFNHAGDIVTKSLVAAKVGTSVSVSRLFANLPVRRHQYRGLRRLQEALTAVEKLLLSLALAHPGLHLSLAHGLERVFSRPACADRGEACRLVLGRHRADALARLQLTRDGAAVEAFVPRRGREEERRLFGTGPRLVFVLVNGRPVEMSEFHKMARNLSRDVFNLPNRYPTSVWFLDLPLASTDVNLDPNKRRVNFEGKEEILAWLEAAVAERLNALPRDRVDHQRTDADPMAWSLGRAGVSQPTEIATARPPPSEEGPPARPEIISRPTAPRETISRPEERRERAAVEESVRREPAVVEESVRRERAAFPASARKEETKKDLGFSPAGRQAKRAREAGGATPAKKPRRVGVASPEAGAWQTRRRAEPVLFDLRELRRRLQSRRAPAAAFGPVVGVLAGFDACFVHHGRRLLLLNNKRGLEMQEEMRLRRDCQLPSARLSEPTPLRPGEFLTPENVRTLASLATREITDANSGEKRLVVCEPALLWNGFRVQCLPDGQFLLCRAPAAFHDACLPLLADLLSHLGSPRPAASPWWRPRAVEQHLRAEATRVARAADTERMSGDQLQQRFVADLWLRRPPSAACWHGKTVWQCVWEQEEGEDCPGEETSI